LQTCTYIETLRSYYSSIFADETKEVVQRATETALQSGLVLAKSGILGAGDNILRTL